MATFEEIYAINVNEKTDKKGNLTYLSWAWAWAEFKKLYPDAQYKADRFDGTYCTGNEKIGYMVHTEVTAGEQTYEMWLPVMDGRNNAILQPKMTEINKAVMRCLTKNLAMFGLGLYIYAGEDLPEGEEDETQNSENKPRSEAKTNEKAPVVQAITKSELVEKWGVKNVEETIAWFEDKLGVKWKEWSEEETEEVRNVLAQRKAKREAEAAKMREGLKGAAADLPFNASEDNQ